jgi:hypothetical protein
MVPILKKSKTSPEETLGNLYCRKIAMADSVNSLILSGAGIELATIVQKCLANGRRH